MEDVGDPTSAGAVAFPNESRVCFSFLKHVQCLLRFPFCGSVWQFFCGFFFKDRNDFQKTFKKATWEAYTISHRRFLIVFCSCLECFPAYPEGGISETGDRNCEVSPVPARTDHATRLTDECSSFVINSQSQTPETGKHPPSTLFSNG